MDPCLEDHHDIDKTTLQQPQKGWRFASIPPWASRHIGGSQQGHQRCTDACKGKPWVAHDKIHSATNVHNPKTDTTVFNNIQPIKRAQSSSAQPGSSSGPNDDTMDKKLTDSLWAVASNRDREHKETRLDSGHTPTRVTRHQHREKPVGRR